MPVGPEISDVENAIVDLSVATLGGSLPYKHGTVFTGLANQQYRVFRGWPQGDIVTTDINASIIDISVAAVPNTMTNTSRFIQDWTEVGAPAPGLTVTLLDGLVTITGTPDISQVLGLVSHGIGYRCALGANDTLATITSRLHAAISGSTVVSVGVIQLPDYDLSFADSFVTPQYVQKEFSRSQMQERISVWAPTNDLRDKTATLLINQYSQTPFLTVLDDVNTRFLSHNQINNDDAMQSGIFRRDLVYTVEWPTIIYLEAPVLIFPQRTVRGNFIGIQSVSVVA